ncbi:MAG: cell wall hydrolase [Pseudomonadota bacterium]
MNILVFLLVFCCHLSALELSEGESSNVMCLAINSYMEANTEPLLGKLAVSQVVLQRQFDKRYSSSICEVIQQGKNEEGCQFSWMCDGKDNNIYFITKAQRTAWFNNLYAAKLMLSDNAPVIKEIIGATLYHRVDIHPWWVDSPKVHYMATIYSHKFYYEDP